MFRFIAIFTTILHVALPVQAAEWVCPADIASVNNGEFCESEHAEYKAKKADKTLNEVYRQLLNDYTRDEDKQPWIVAQRAWLKFMEADCFATSQKNAGASFTKNFVYFSCRNEKTIQRTKELKSYCESCN